MILQMNAADSLRSQQPWLWKNRLYIHLLLNAGKKPWSSDARFKIIVKDESVNAGTGLECVISVGLFSPGH